MVEPDPYQQKERLEAALAEYRRERADTPQYYYNELAERGRAVARFRPVLESFLAGQINLAEFKAAAAGFSRGERTAARGREQGRYWRFSGAGRLFLDSIYRQAENAGRSNALSLALQTALKVPGSLDEAGRHFQQLALALRDLQVASPERSAPRLGLMNYVLSYFWAMQSLEWPIYSRETREALVRLRLLGIGKGEDAAAANYSLFYLAFMRLAKELELNAWELESFLHWRTQRDTLEIATLVAPKRRSDKPAWQRRRLVQLEELKAGLESRLRNEVAGGLRGVVGRDEAVEKLVFQEIDTPTRLELWLEEKPRAGVAFGGFNPASLNNGAGRSLLSEINGFLVERPEYRYYTDPAKEPKDPALPDFRDEFYLLREFPAPHEDFSLADALLDEWRLLYPFARRVSLPFDESLPPLVTGAPAEAEEGASFAYPAEEEPPLRQVAEEGEAYSVQAESYAGLEEPEDEGSASAVPLPSNGPELERRLQEVQATRLAENEAKRLAQLTVPSLSAEQMEALMVFVTDRLVIPPEKIKEIVTHLEAGRNILLYGPPGCGKTRLARLVAGQLCSRDPGWIPESEATNYTIATATAEWTTYEVIGGIRPGLATEIEQYAAQPAENTTPPRDQLQYFFEPGVVARAALDCETSLKNTGRPHYLIIDEFNRANQDSAFGELFTLLEYRDRPLLPGKRLGRRAPLYLPDAFRLVGTMNSEDRNTLFDLGMALRRRFALVEIGLPDPEAERRFLPRALHARLPQVELDEKGDFASPELRQARDRLVKLVAAIRPDPVDPQAGGKKLGTGLVLEALVFCAVAARFYRQPLEALEDAILADILPQLDRSPAGVTRALKAVSENGPLPELARVRKVLQRMERQQASYY